MKVNIGGDRLGSGAKMNVELNHYYRSTHNLSKNFKSSMACGVLYPCYVNVGLNGDKFEIDTQTQVRTIPTQGPLFGSFKMQVDWFVCPIRLYQGVLHNNPINIGMNMSQVKLPTVMLQSKDVDLAEDELERYSTSQIHPANLWKYFGLSGLGTSQDGVGNNVTREINAVPLLAYYDIFKNYYANKQEENAYVITPKGNHLVKSSMYVAYLEDNTGARTYINANTYISLDVTKQYTLVVQGINLMKPNGAVNINFTPVGKVGRWIFTTQGMTDTRLAGAIIYNGTNATTGGFTLTNDSYLAALEDVELKPFELKVIDDMREKILQHTTLNAPFKINSVLSNSRFANLYGQSFESFNADGETVFGLNYPLAGMVVKTYQSDLFNNWVNTEWIDGTNGIAEITKVDTTNGLQMDALNLAQKVYNMLNRIAVAGGTYEDWQEAVYTQSTIRKAETPMYVGGMSSEIMFEEVIATTVAQDQDLGSLGGRGKQIGMKGGNIEFKVEEPCIIMAIASLTPRISYSQGNKWFLTDLFSIDDLHKPALDGIGYQDLLVEQMAWWGTEMDNSAGRPITRQTAGKVPAWIQYMTDVDETYGDFAAAEGKAFMALNRNYTAVKNQDYMQVADITTYIDPQKYNYAFAHKEASAQNFWAEIQFNIKARRLMSAKQIPNL